MLTTLLLIFLALVFLVIYLEYKNERKYQKERKKRNTENTKPHTLPVDKAKTPINSNNVEPTSLNKHNDLAVNTHITEASKPQVKYPKFSHSRLVDMGLSDDEAKEFATELIPQIEMQIPLIKESIKLSDFHQVERLTHHIKGSATNIGTGGVSDLLVEYNTYLKSGTDISIIEIYFKDLLYYTKELKSQYT